MCLYTHYKAVYFGDVNAYSNESESSYLSFEQGLYMNDDRSLETLRSIQVESFDWLRWQPGIKSTLVFIIRDHQILLIHKKTGLGRGKVNGPGGKVESGESWIDCARREVSEELQIQVGELNWAGELCFLMSDYPDIQCQVFFAKDYMGEPTETREARPFWCPVDEIPFERMWTDDRYWLPRALNGERILGRFVFEGETLLNHSVTLQPEQFTHAVPIDH